MRKLLQLLLISCLFVSCSSDDDKQIPEEPVHRLEISCNRDLRIDDYDFEFDVLDGNGGYEVEFAQEGSGKATIDGDKVTIHLLTNRVNFTLKDQRGESLDITVYSTLEALIPTSYSVFSWNGNTSVNSIYFGVGGYILEKISGNSAEVEVLEDDRIRIVPLRGGPSFYKLTDKRGTTADYRVDVGELYELTGNTLDITAVNDQLIQINLRTWGEGEWEFIGDPSSGLFERVILQPGGTSLQIKTSPERALGRTFIKLKDKAGNQATIQVTIN